MREKIPNIAIRSTFISGFPTETEEMFNNTLELIKKADITHLHVFPYSVRTGTPAAKMPQVPVPVRKERAKILRTVGENLLFEYMQGKIGQTVEVLYETEGKGLCGYYLPVFVGGGFTAGDYVSVRLIDIKDGIFIGSVL